MNPLHEESVEKILKRLPQFERSKKAEQAFFAKLHRMAKIEHPIRGWFSWPRLSFAGSLATLFILVSGTVWAYQSNVTRGHFLYPWKKAVERMELASASSSLQKVDAHLRFSDRRLEEARSIIQQNPSLAWLFQTAFAHGDEIHLDTEEEIFLAETLTDMRSEVSQASEIVETAISALEDLQKALSKIETATDRHLESLEELEKQTSKNAQAVVKKIAQEEDDQLAKVLDAQDEIEEARGKKLERVQIKLLRRELKRQQRSEQAQEALQKTLRLFESLPQEERKDLSEKMERAKEALESGKFGRVKGLSKALKSRMENMERRIEEQRPDKEPSGEPGKEQGKKPRRFDLKPETIKKQADESLPIELKDLKSSEEETPESAERVKKERRAEELIKKIPLIDPEDIKNVGDFDEPINPTKKIHLVDPEDIQDLDDTESTPEGRSK